MSQSDNTCGTGAGCLYKDALIESQRDQIDALRAVNAELVEALTDMNNGWKYIRNSHGDLYGVGWDRAQDKADAALAKAKELKGTP